MRAQGRKAAFPKETTLRPVRRAFFYATGVTYLDARGKSWELFVIGRKSLDSLGKGPCVDGLPTSISPVSGRSAALPSMVIAPGATRATVTAGAVALAQASGAAEVFGSSVAVCFEDDTASSPGRRAIRNTARPAAATARTMQVARFIARAL